MGYICMVEPTILKGSGYLVSIGSVLLLGAVAWNSASEDPILLVLLIAGMAASIFGMFLRWMSYWERQQK